MKQAILVVEDDLDLREAISDTLELSGYQILSAENGRVALSMLDEHPIHLVISDVQMDVMDGHTLLKNIKRLKPELPVLLMTAYGTIENAIKAIQDGAVDYLVKPFESTVLISKVEQVIPKTIIANDGMVAVDRVTRGVLEMARRVANSEATVMITGDSGTGKEVLFRYIHMNSARADKDPVAINCAAIPDNMLEAILFGYEKGAFTGAYKASSGKFEQAQGSTLLLDEVSEMDAGLQAKLLRVLQEKQVERLGGNKVIDLDVRVVATSNRDLRQEVNEGRFREDLYYRLNVFPIKMPSLKQRQQDIIPIAEYLIRRAAGPTGAQVPKFSQAVIKKLNNYSWPGNVRELDNVMQRALILHNSDQVEEGDLIFEDNEAGLQGEQSLATEQFEDEAESSINTTSALSESLKDQEQQLIIDTLKEGNGSRKFAAEKLGISPRTLRYKLAKMRDAGLNIPA